MTNYLSGWNVLSGVTAKLNHHPRTLSVPFIKQTNKQTNLTANITQSTCLYSLKAKIIFIRHLSTSDTSHQVQHKLMWTRHIHMAVRLTASYQTSTGVSCTWKTHKFIPSQNLTIHVHLVKKCGVHKPVTKFYYTPFRPGVARISWLAEETKPQFRQAIG